MVDGREERRAELLREIRLKREHLLISSAIALEMRAKRLRAEADECEREAEELRARVHG